MLELLCHLGALHSFLELCLSSHILVFGGFCYFRRIVTDALSLRDLEMHTEP